jgi:hypothetical protein
MWLHETVFPEPLVCVSGCVYATGDSDRRGAGYATDDKFVYRARVRPERKTTHDSPVMTIVWFSLLLDRSAWYAFSATAYTCGRCACFGIP